MNHTNSTPPAFQVLDGGNDGDTEEAHADWTSGGVGDSVTLADLILSRLSAPASEVFGPALKRLTQWLLFGEGEHVGTDRGIVNRVNVLAYFLEVQGDGVSVVDFCERQGLDRAGFYRYVESLERMFGCELKESRSRKRAA